MNRRKRARAEMDSKEDDSFSLASSTSLWVLEREPTKEKRTPVITLNEKQYNILINLVKQPRLLGCGLHWMPNIAIPSWDCLTQLNRHCFVVPLCYMWLGHLRLALLREEDIEESESVPLYLSILNAMMAYTSRIMSKKKFRWNLNVALHFSDPASYKLHLEHPLRFIVFRHQSNGEFEVSVQPTIKNISITDITPRHHPYGSMSKHHAEQVDAASFSEHLSMLRSIPLAAISSSNLDTCNRFNSRLVHFTAPQSPCYLDALDAALEEDSEAEREMQGFSLQLERSVASISTEVQNSGTEVDHDRLKQLIFMQDSNDLWQLNPVVTADIYDTLKTFIKKKGERLLNDV